MTQEAADQQAEIAAGAVGELGALADRLYNQEPVPDFDDVLMEYLDWAESTGKPAWPHQEEALMDLMAGDHVILGTPTGSGKSLVALGLHFKALALGGGVSYYTAPIKALVSEKFFELVELLGKDYVGMITGDTAINPGAPVICCTAEILANRALREGEDAPIGFVAMDEFHYYGDPDRGWAWQVPLLTLPKTQFLLMSATLGDVSSIAASLEERTGRTVDVIADAPRPVPLSFEYVDTSLEGTVELALRNGKGPIYVVHFGQDAALASAQALASYGVATKEERQLIKDACKGTSFSTAFGKVLQRLLGCGVGLHHAGMLPRYRLLVEKLAQQGLLPVICGTDTLGVGINVPIHTVLITALTKFDGHKMRRLNAREFHQIAGRAGRSGFDTEGEVIVQAPEHEIENAKLRQKAGNDPKKLKKIKLKKPREGSVTWNQQAFDRVVAAVPETLRPRMRASHSMALAMVEQGGNARQRMRDLIMSSAQPEEEKLRLLQRTDEVFVTLVDAGVVLLHAADGTALSAGEIAAGLPDDVTYELGMDVPDDFALDQPLSPFLLAALELLDPEDPDYALDVISMAEATVEDPRQVLRAQERKAKDKALAEMKMEGVEYEERLERLEEVTYPMPLKEELDGAFALYCESVPWAGDYELHPKSVLREMVQMGATFKGYVAAYGIARSEGTLLRYLSDIYRVLDRTIPLDKRDDRLWDIISWLGVVVRSIDSSLLDEWAGVGSQLDDDVAAPLAPQAVVLDRRGMTVLVRNALFQRVRLAAQRKIEQLAELDGDWGFGVARWSEVLDRFYADHEELLTDGDARSTAYFTVDESGEAEHHTWHVEQVLHDVDGDHDYRIVAEVDLDATQDGGEVVFSSYNVGSFEDLD
ncbi:MAG: DUF3516 domain-containing protein [Coriobacteriia bacterium]|nr:DUF3516 domain-containing protein [Coriobacteriia bacterium]